MRTLAISVSTCFVFRAQLPQCRARHAEHFGLKGVLEKPSIGSTRIPSIVFCVFQLMFAAITPILALGAVAERARLGPTIVFTFIWTTIVYDPIACWTWNSNGWAFVMGGLDFAGGTPVHISSGTAALAISMVCVLQTFDITRTLDDSGRPIHIDPQPTGWIVSYALCGRVARESALLTRSL